MDRREKRSSRRTVPFTTLAIGTSASSAPSIPTNPPPPVGNIAMLSPVSPSTTVATQKSSTATSAATRSVPPSGPSHLASPSPVSPPTAVASQDSSTAPSDAVSSVALSVPTHVPVAHAGWLETSRLFWISGPATLSGIQVDKGLRIFDILATIPLPIPSLKDTPGRCSASGCTFLGQAVRSGPPPDERMILRNVLACGSSANIANSFTNLEESEHEVSAVDVIAQCTNFLRNRPLAPGEPLYTLIDIPATPEGLLRCQYRTGSYVDGSNARLSPPTTTWTFPGAITYPHMDGMCGMHMVHLMGKKIWLFWPATKHNYAVMSLSRLGSVDFASVLDQLRNLEGLEVLVLGDEDQGVAFEFLPNTIHCCLSLTESRHHGRPFRAVAHTALLPDLFRLDAEWIKDVLLVDDDVSEASKRAKVAQYVEDIFHYHALAADIGECDPVGCARLVDVLQHAWNDIAPYAHKMSITGDVLLRC